MEQGKDKLEERNTGPDKINFRFITVTTRAPKRGRLYGDGKGNFEKQTISAATIGNHESKFGDVNGDGRPDLVQKPFMKDVPRLDIWINQGSQKPI